MPGGWMRTGDRATRAEDGWLVFADRAKDMLKVGGENVAASEIERVIAGIPGVVEVAVVGKPHAMLDEVPVAFVRIAVPEMAQLQMTDTILSACRTNLSRFKVPDEIRIVDDFPRATLEKVAKGELRSRLRAEASQAAGGVQ